MVICKFVSSAKLVEYLEQEFLEVLNKRGIYDIHQFGWLDDDLPDPDYQGLAQWQSGELAANISGGGRNGLRRSGDGFISHMHMSLHSLGLALVFVAGGRENVSLFCEAALGFHCRDVVLKLGLASLCLRDFFVLLTDSMEDNITESYGHMDPETFQAPFVRACIGLDNDIDEAMPGHFRRIASLAVDIAGKCHLCERLNSDLGGMVMPFSLSCSETDKGGDDFGATVEGMINDLCDWYELLIEAGNSIFMLMGDMSRRRDSGRVSIDEPVTITPMVK